MKVRILRITSVLLAAGLGLALTSAPAGAVGGRSLDLRLSGANEFSASGEPINPHGVADRASMTLTLNVGKKRVCWSVENLVLTAGDALPHAAHIHLAPVRVAGPVVLDLFQGSAPTTYPSATRCVTADRDLIRHLKRHASSYYVNMHNAQHPAGVVRAQLG